MLSYSSVHGAEAALGRQLTMAEKIWFKYSAKQADHLLYFHNILLFFVFYSLVSISYIFVELSRSKKVHKYKIQPNVNKSITDMFACYKYVAKTYILVVGCLQISSYPIIKWIGIRTSLPLPTGWEMCWQIMVYFVIEDYSNYWIHRLLHCKWAYEKIHRVHHEFTSPMALAAPYAHWVEVLLLGIPSFLGPALVPGHMITFWLWFILRQIEAIDTHSGYEFPWSPAKYIPFYGGADYHDCHHFVGAKAHSNFASVFTYCDYIYGTSKGYRYQKSIISKGKREN